MDTGEHLFYGLGIMKFGESNSLFGRESNNTGVKS